MSPRNSYELMVVGGSIGGFLIKRTSYTYPVDENSGNQMKSKKITTEAEEILEITTKDIEFKTTLNQLLKDQ